MVDRIAASAEYKLVYNKWLEVEGSGGPNFPLRSKNARDLVNGCARTSLRAEDLKKRILTFSEKSDIIYIESERENK